MKKLNSCDFQKLMDKVNVNDQGNACLTDVDMSIQPEICSSLGFAEMLITDCGHNFVRQILCNPKNVVSEEHVEGDYDVQWSCVDGPCLMKLELYCDFIYEGETREGFPYGKGVMKFVNGESDFLLEVEEYGEFEQGWEYKGDVIYGIPHGEGIWSGPDGTTYSGTWRNGMLVNGTKIQPSGREGTKPIVLKGTFYHGLLTGDSCEIDRPNGAYEFGTSYHPNGDILAGRWKDGNLVEGKIIHPDGSIKEIKPDQTQSGDNTPDEA